MVYPILMAAIIPMSLISYDERDQWTHYSGALPYSRKQLVSVKYLVGLIFLMGAFLVVMAVWTVKAVIQNTFSLGNFLAIGGILLPIGFIGPSLLLPVVFKFGAEKGRIAFYVIIGAICAAGVLLTGVNIQGEDFGGYGELWQVLICAASLILYLASWKISIIFYTRREL